MKRYLVSKKSVAHLWDGEDTYCRMYSTGGLKKSKYSVVDYAGDRRICINCRSKDRLRREWIDRFYDGVSKPL